MLKTITNLNEFSFTPEISVDGFNGKEYKVFGKQVFIRDHHWLRNVHIKITDKCNARCDFCVEKGSNIKDNQIKLLANLEILLRQMNEQGILSTVTVTGGEPTLAPHFQNVLNLVAKYDVFSSVNTNGSNPFLFGNSPDWVNISKHAIDDGDVFCRENVTKEMMAQIKQNSGSNLRVHGVMLSGKLDSIDSIKRFIDHFSDVADDFGFRQLIRTNKAQAHHPDLTEFRRFLFDNAKFVEQVLQDYYVYEIWEFMGKSITLSFSDMKTLQEAEVNEPQDIIRELIVHPDGVVSGDWARKTKVLVR